MIRIVWETTCGTPDGVVLSVYVAVIEAPVGTPLAFATGHSSSVVENTGPKQVADVRLKGAWPKFTCEVEKVDDPGDVADSVTLKVSGFVALVFNVTFTEATPARSGSVNVMGKSVKPWALAYKPLEAVKLLTMTSWANVFAGLLFTIVTFVAIGWNNLSPVRAE